MEDIPVYDLHRLTAIEQKDGEMRQVGFSAILVSRRDSRCLELTIGMYDDAFKGSAPLITIKGQGALERYVPKHFAISTQQGERYLPQDPVISAQGDMFGEFFGKVMGEDQEVTFSCRGDKVPKITFSKQEKAGIYGVSIEKTPIQKAEIGPVYYNHDAVDRLARQTIGFNQSSTIQGTTKKAPSRTA